MSDTADLAVDALAAYRITRLLIEDAVLDQPRQSLLRRLEAGGHDRLLYLSGCYWCLGLWVAAGVTVVRGTRWWRRAAPALALSTITGAIAERV